MALIERQRKHVHSQRHLLNVQSSNRDLTKWPNANDYAIDLPTQYRNVTNMTLLTPEFQNEQYVISATNNKLLVDAAVIATPDIVTITPGTYTPTTLATALVAAIDAAPSVTAATVVTYNTDTRKYTFSNGGASGLTFLVAASQDSTDPNYDNSIASELIWETIGFFDTTTNPVAAAAGATTFDSDGVVNLERDRFLIMEIRNRDILVGRMDSTGPHANPFAKIMFNPETNCTGVYTFVPMSVVFNTITRIKTLHFQFRRPNGELVEHHGVNHSFTLEFVTVTQEDRHIASGIEPVNAGQRRAPIPMHASNKRQRLRF